MKTLLFLLEDYPAFGGIETVTTALANALTGHFRIIICSGCWKERHEILLQLHPEITFWLLPQNKQKQEVIACLDSLLSEEHIDIVIYQDSYAPIEYLAYYIAERKNIKLIVAEHNAPGLSKSWIPQLFTLPWWNIYKRLKLIYYGTKGHLQTKRRRTGLYRLCDRYVVLSEHFKPEFVRNSYTEETSKLRAIGNPITISPLPCVPANKKKQILFIGRFVAIKGLDRLLRIWGRVQDAAPDWSLELVGDGPFMPSVRQQIQKQQLKRVELRGYQAAPLQFFTDASIFCLCSSFEGFPMVLPEAMGRGCVPVCFNSFAALEDIISDGVDGYSIPAFDEEAFAARLLQLMQDDKIRRRMAEAALAKTEDFNIKTITARWENLIEELLYSPS